MLIMCASPGKRTFQDFLFPTFGPESAAVNREGKVESRVSQVWNNAFATILGLAESYCVVLADDGETFMSRINPLLGSHHAKKAANVDMSDSCCAGFGQIFRTGWLVGAIHSVFKYIHGTEKMDTEAGKTLAGWKTKLSDVIIGGYPPEKKDLKDNETLFTPFVRCLFVGCEEDFPQDLLELLAMSVLLRYDDVLDHITKEPHGKYQVPTAHPFVHNVHRALRESCVGMVVFQSWKKDATEAFIRKNRLGLDATFNPLMNSVLCETRPLLQNYQDLARAHFEVKGMFCCLLLVGWHPATLHCSNTVCSRWCRTVWLRGCFLIILATWLLVSGNGHVAVLCVPQRKWFSHERMQTANGHGRMLSWTQCYKTSR